MLAATIVHAVVFGPGNAVAPKLTPASATVLQAIRGVTPAEQDAVGLPASVAVPLVAKGEPALRLEGRSGALYIGAEWCPYCAALRWAIVMAFDRFGTFSGLQETTSSPWDSDPSTPTLSFVDARYSSRYLALVTVEREGNDTHGLGTRTNLQPLTRDRGSVMGARTQPVSARPRPFPSSTSATRSSFSAQPMTRAPSPASINDRSPPPSRGPPPRAARDIVGAANYLTAAICQVTDGQPLAVCTVKAVQTAARSLKLG